MQRHISNYDEELQIKQQESRAVARKSRDAS